MSKRLITALFGVLAIALVAGCGGSSDSSGSESSEASSSLTKAEFVKQGDAICKKGDAAIEEEANEFAAENNIDTKNPTESDQEEVIEQVVGPAIKHQGEEIAELGAPSGEEEEVEAIVSAVETGAEEVEEDPAAILKGKNPLGEAARLAKAYGFKVCGQEA